MKKISFILSLALSFLLGCASLQTQKSSDLFEFTILQFNDVYEIAPIEGGKAGGLARVAHVLNQLKAENPHTISVLPGDFLSPTLITNLKPSEKIEGVGENEKVAGLQMIETLNALGLDYATFGNHEFDLSDLQLLNKRINQCDFKYVCCNIKQVDGGQVKPFTQLIDGKAVDIPPYIIHEFKDKSGATLKLGMIGIVLPFNKKPYLEYEDPIENFLKTYEIVKKEADIVIGLTHQDMEDDIKLAAQTTGVPILMGGHEHVHLNHYIEETIITKADANAKTVYVHRFSFDPATKLVKVKSSLKKIDENIPDDPTTAKVVETWNGRLDAILEGMGFEPNKELMTTDVPLICTEAIIRDQQTNYGTLTCKSLETAFPGEDIYLVNSGSMRLDDNLVGTIKEYDVLRTFPYGGPLVTMQIPGKDLNTILNIGLLSNKGDGGYFQILNVTGDKDAWKIKEQALDNNKSYKIALPQFVAKGQEAGLSIFSNYTFNQPDKLKVGNTEIPNDLRNLVSAYMESL